jgi:hypothetical protein
MGWFPAVCHGLGAILTNDKDVTSGPRAPAPSLAGPQMGPEPRTRGCPAVGPRRDASPRSRLSGVRRDLSDVVADV